MKKTWHELMWSKEDNTSVLTGFLGGKSSQEKRYPFGSVNVLWLLAQYHFLSLACELFCRWIEFVFLCDRSLPRSEFLLFLVNSKLFMSGSLSPIASLQELCCHCTSIHSHFCYFIPMTTMHLVDKSPCQHSNLFFLLSATPRGICWSYSKLFPWLVVPLGAIFLLDSK